VLTNYTNTGILTFTAINLCLIKKQLSKHTNQLNELFLILINTANRTIPNKHKTIINTLTII
jgi:hypothetical protein